jgi:hypothetical protein
MHHILWGKNIVFTLHNKTTPSGTARACLPLSYVHPQAVCDGRGFGKSSLSLNFLQSF